MAAHVLGWVGQISADEIKDKKFKNYGPNDLVGKSGLEQVYERFLQGTKGQAKFLVELEPGGRRVPRLGQPRPGERPRAVARRQRAADRRAGPSGRDRQDPQDLRHLAESCRLPQGELRSRDRDGPEDRRDQSAGVVADVRSLLVRAGTVEARSRRHVRGPAPARPRSIERRSFRSPRDRRSSRSSRFPHCRTASPTWAATTPVRRTTSTPATRRRCSTTGRPRTSDRSPSRRPCKVSCDTVFYQFGADFYDLYHADPFGAHASLLQNSLRQFGFGNADPARSSVGDGRASSPTRPGSTGSRRPTRSSSTPARTLAPRRRHPDGDRTGIRDGYAAADGDGVLGDRERREDVPAPRRGSHRGSTGRTRCKSIERTVHEEVALHASRARLHPQRARDRHATGRHGLRGVRRVPPHRGPGRRQDRHRTATTVPGHVVVRGHGAGERPAVRHRRDGGAGRSRLDVCGADRAPGDRRALTGSTQRGP